jgi:hypothetical protein
MVTEGVRVNNMLVRARDAPHQVVTDLGKPRDDDDVSHIDTESEG